MPAGPPCPTRIPPGDHEPLVVNQVGRSEKIKLAAWLNSLALWSIFINNKALGLTLFPSIKNLADSWHGCRTSAAPSTRPAPPGSPAAKPGVGGASGIPARSCLIVTLQLAGCVHEWRRARFHSVYAVNSTQTPGLFTQRR